MLNNSAVAPPEASEPEAPGAMETPPWAPISTLFWLATVVALLSACGAGGATSSPTLNQPPVATIERVVDGDTVIVRIAGQEESVRLLGIDTPEVAHGDLAAECYGDAATGQLRALVPEGSHVVLYRDHEARDHFGRLLAYIFRSDDGLFVNLELLASGHAEVLTIAPNTAYTSVFHSVQANARATGQGLWAACG